MLGSLVVLGRVVCPLPASAGNEETGSDIGTRSEPHAASIRIVRPPPVVTGHRIFTAIADGERIAGVRFLLDGQVVATVREPPFEAGIGLGYRPRERTLAVEAMGAGGSILARDEVDLNTGVARFAVMLEDPAPTDRDGEWLRVRAQVDAPAARTVERIELYLDDESVATWTEPPWEGRIRVHAASPALLRAEAHLDEGAVAEDILPLNVAAHDSLRVDLVELSTAVVDRRGQHVVGMGRDDFRVRENGVFQRIERFLEVRNAPVHTALVVDTSASMTPIMEPVRDAAQSFLEALITPRDRATVVTFASRSELRVSFTEDLRLLTRGVAELEAGGGTALYDSLVFSLEQFLGIRGQRALVLLSDGKDNVSQHTAEEVMALARRAAVTIYSIGIEERRFGEPSRLDRPTLRRLARETGGRSYFVESPDELHEVYAGIEEDLRSRYLLSYYSSADSLDRSFRRVDVEIPSTRLRARTIRGYYP